jgi:hypothetical protein
MFPEATARKNIDRLLQVDVVTPDQVRTIVRTFRDKLFSEIFPGRSEVPKTLIFAKDDNHAENIVEILREEFGKGNEFAQKITYRTTGATPKELISAFRNSYHPRVAVTVDMIATGTDIKLVEIVFFMRAVKSRDFFEQMKGRGVRVIKPDDFKAVKLVWKPAWPATPSGFRSAKCPPCSSATNRSSPGISAIFSKRASWCAIELLQILQQLRLMIRPTRSSTSTSSAPGACASRF